MCVRVCESITRVRVCWYPCVGVYVSPRVCVCACVRAYVYVRVYVCECIWLLLNTVRL